MANEVNFCGELAIIHWKKIRTYQTFFFLDSYTDAVDNRTSFPLDNGFITLTSEHPQWTGKLILWTSDEA